MSEESSERHTRSSRSIVDLPFEGGDGKRLGGDLVRLSGTEEGGGNAEAGDEEEKGRANHLRFARQLCLWLLVVLEEKKLKSSQVLTRSLRAYLSILKLRSRTLPSQASYF